MEVPAQGRLLIASPLLGDPNFERAVVLVLSHGTEGSLGLVLNRPSTTEVASPLPRWERLATAPTVVFVGGPVKDGAICLAEVGQRGELPGYTPFMGRLGTLDLGTDPEALASAVRRMRVFAGYAGWSPGQLEREMDAEAWWTVDAEGDDLFSADPAGLWKRVLRRQRGELALVSAYPADVRMN